MSILLGLANLFEVIADTIEYGPVEAAKINISFVPEYERAIRRIEKDSEKKSYKADTGFSKTGSNDLMGSISKVVSDVGNQKSTENIIDEIEEETIQKAVKEKSCW